MFQGAPWACKRPTYWAHNRSLELIYDALTLRNGKSCIIPNRSADSGLPTDDAEMSNLNATFCSGFFTVYLLFDDAKVVTYPDIKEDFIRYGMRCGVYVVR